MTMIMNEGGTIYAHSVTRRSPRLVEFIKRHRRSWDCCRCWASSLLLITMVRLKLLGTSC